MVDVADFLDVTPLYASGVYMLLHGERVVYVGQSKCLMRRLADHEHNAHRPQRKFPGAPKLMRFNGIKVCFLPLDQLDFIERELIIFYKPFYNVVHKPKPDLAALLSTHLPTVRPPPAAPTTPLFTRRI